MSQHARTIHTDAKARAAIAGSFAAAPELDDRPVSTRMAEACITIHAEQPAGVTRPALLEAGFSGDDIDAHFADAALRANTLFLRDVATDNAQPEPPHLVAARMRVAVGELLPPRQFVVTQLQALGFTKTQIDTHLAGAIDRAGHDFSGIAVPPILREVA